MDSSFWVQQWHQFIFMLATNGHIVFLGTLAISVLGLGPIGRAIASRIRSGAAPALPVDDPSMVALKSAMGEVLERLDFSERVLTELSHRTLGPGPLPPRAEAPRDGTPV